MGKYPLDRVVAASVCTAIVLVMAFVIGQLTNWTMKPGTPLQMVCVGSALLAAVIFSASCGRAVTRLTAIKVATSHPDRS